MYVGRVSLTDIAHFLLGYRLGLTSAGLPDPMDNFERWIEMRFRISDSAWHWTRILLHVYGSDAAALEALPSLYDEFIVELERIGFGGIEDEFTRRCVEKYGKSRGAPSETATKPMGEQ